MYYLTADIKQQFGCGRLCCNPHLGVRRLCNCISLRRNSYQTRELCESTESLFSFPLTYCATGHWVEAQRRADFRASYTFLLSVLRTNLSNTAQPLRPGHLFILLADPLSSFPTSAKACVMPSSFLFIILEIGLKSPLARILFAGFRPDHSSSCSVPHAEPPSLPMTSYVSYFRFCDVLGESMSRRKRPWCKRRRTSSVTSICWAGYCSCDEFEGWALVCGCGGSKGVEFCDLANGEEG